MCVVVIVAERDHHAFLYWNQAALGTVILVLTLHSSSLCKYLSSVTWWCCLHWVGELHWSEPGSRSTCLGEKTSVRAIGMVTEWFKCWFPSCCQIAIGYWGETGISIFFWSVLIRKEDTLPPRLFFRTVAAWVGGPAEVWYTPPCHCPQSMSQSIFSFWGEICLLLQSWQQLFCFWSNQ